MTRLIQAQDLAVSTMDALHVVGFLALESGNVRLTKDQRARVLALTVKGERLLDQNQLIKDYRAAKKRTRRKP